MKINSSNNVCIIPNFSAQVNFLQKCCDIEDSLLAEINPEISSKLEKIRNFIKDTGLSIENAKKWL